MKPAQRTTAYPIHAVFTAAAAPRNMSGRMLVRRVLDTLAADPALIDAILDDGIRTHREAA